MADQVQEKLDDGMKKKHIVFGNPVFHAGLNFTIRDGADYFKKKGLKVGELIEMYDTKNEYLGYCSISHKMICTLQDVPPFVFAKEHDPECKNPIVLMDVLESVYGRQFKGTDMVTCVGFIPRQQ